MPERDHLAPTISEPSGHRTQTKRWGHRSCSPAETFDWLKRFFPATGITRVADITGLDNLGIPVFQAVRPMGRSLSVSQGKGVDAMAAKVSAVMEAVEVWHAEHEALPSFRASGQAIAECPKIDVNTLRRPSLPEISQYVPLRWCKGTDLADGAEILIPGDAGNLDFTRAADPPELARSTTGLAGGNTIDEARASAISEVIERSCHAEFLALDERAQSRRRIDPNSLTDDDPTIADLVRRIASANIELDLYDITNRIDVTAIRAVFYTLPSGRPTTRPAVGHGAHLDPMTAVIRALTEAAQSRLAYISGNRDDLDPAYYRGSELANVVRAMRKGMDFSGTRRRLNRPDESTTTAGADAEKMIGNILAAKAGPVAEINLTKSNLGVPVVKIVAPRVSYLASP